MMEKLLVQELANSVPKRFVVDLLKSVEWAYAEARNTTQNDQRLGTAEAEYLEPHCRRCFLERRLQDIAALHQLRTNIAKVKSNRYQYTELFSGRFLLTVIHASSTSKIVRGSSFRKSGALLNKFIDQQEFNLDLPDQRTLSDDVDLNAVIYHGTDYRHRYRAGFLKIGVPSSENRRWACCPIDMYVLLDAYPPEQSNVEDQDLIIHWKRKSGEKAS